MILQYTPVLLGLVLVLFFFAYALSRGVVGLLGSSLAALSAIVVFFLSVNLLPMLGTWFGNIDLTWKVTLGVAAALALLTYIGGYFVFRGIVKYVFNPDTWLHSFSDGIFGGILSLFPSAVAIFFLFSCVRIAGTVQELNYAASISQDGIESMGGNIPPIPMMVSWRNGIEQIPFAAMTLDALDPFSNRQYRKAAAFLMMTGSGSVRSYLLSRDDTRLAASSPELSALRRDVDLRRALEGQDRLGVVLNRKLQEFAKESDVAEYIRDVRLEPVLQGFVDSLPRPEIPPAETAG